jgi:hypothetical protein
MIVEKWIMHTPKGDFEFGYKMGETPNFTTKPVWMSNFKKSWDSPQDPVLFEFTLEDETYAQDAFNFLYNGPANGIAYPSTEAQS